jgi:hypothetical protein
MTNLEVFDRVTAAMLAKLYKEFPRPITFEFIELKEPAKVPDDSWHEISLGGRPGTGASVAQWLVDEGYVRCTDMGEDAIANAVLSQKGLEILRAVPRLFDSGGRPLGEVLSELPATILKSGIQALLDAGLAALRPS